MPASHHGSPNPWIVLGWILQVISLVVGAATVARVVVQIDFATPNKAPILATVSPRSTVPAVLTTPTPVATSRSLPNPVPPELPAQSFPLIAGKVFYLDVRGDRVEVWSDGVVEAAADGGSYETLPVPGRRLRFTRGASRIHVHPLDSRATRVFVRRLPY